MSSTSPRIERAAALLDQTAPGWTSKIDLARLDMSNTSYCIVGQLYGDYYKGLTTLNGEAERSPARYGFMTWGAEHYSDLAWKWRTFIEWRRSKDAAA